VNLYGAHLFHTSKERVWHYMNRFSSWTPYEHRVVGRVDGKLVPIPVNIDTVNALAGARVGSVAEMRAWLAEARRSGGAADPPRNSRDVGVSRVGKELYEKIFHEYTKKQWGVFPEALEPEVLARIPVREDWDDRYFPNDPFQALPARGYTAWFEVALRHPNLTVLTSTDYFTMPQAQGAQVVQGLLHGPANATSSFSSPRLLRRVCDQKLRVLSHGGAVQLTRARYTHLVVQPAAGSRALRQRQF
jgi:UDP-galactopyranose mutase